MGVEPLRGAATRRQKRCPSPPGTGWSGSRTTSRSARRVLEQRPSCRGPLPGRARRRGGGLSLLLPGWSCSAMFGGVSGTPTRRSGVGLVGDPPLDPRPARALQAACRRNRGGLQVENQTASVINVFHPPASSEQPVAELLPPAPPPSRPDPTAGEQRITASDPTDLSKLPPLPVPTPPEPPLQALEAPDLPALQVPPPAATPPHAPAKAAAHAAPPRVRGGGTSARPRGAGARGRPRRPHPTRPDRGRHGRARQRRRGPAGDSRVDRQRLPAPARLREERGGGEPGLGAAPPALPRPRQPLALGRAFATPSGTNYRLQAGPFPGFQAASAACTAIQAQGGQCIVTTAR